jgi:AraC-like DNA-binding protein
MTSLSYQSSELGMPGVDGNQSWQINDIQICSGFHSQNRAAAPNSSVLLPVDSHLTVHQGNVEQILRAPHDLLYLTAGAHHERIGAFRGVVIRIDQQRLARIATELSSFRLSATRCRQRLGDIRIIQPRHNAERDLVHALHQILEVVELPGLEQNNLLGMIGLEQLIYRNLALAICGDMIHKCRSRATDQQRTKASIIDELLDWIRDNLDRPIHLSDLEERSGYSQRSLRNVFQDRFNCGPTHWIRTQRLEAARQRLLDPERNDTVSSVAMAYGYQHLSQFSRDFQSTYRIKPSDLLREGLRRTE